MTPAIYRKRPVEVEAVLLTPDNVREVAEWCGGQTFASVGLLVPTLEGVMRADFGDWIIRGVEGEHYPCKPTVFAATYTEVL